MTLISVMSLLSFGIKKSQKCESCILFLILLACPGILLLPDVSENFKRNFLKLIFHSNALPQLPSQFFTLSCTRGSLKWLKSNFYPKKKDLSLRFESTSNIAYLEEIVFYFYFTFKPEAMIWKLIQLHLLFI